MEESSFNLCQFKDALGKPGEGIRKYRIFDISVVDFVLAIVLGLLFAKIFKIKKINGVLISFLLGIISHKIFCVDTTINKVINKMVK